MTTPSLTPILDAVRDVRAKYEPDAAGLAAGILAGDAGALAVGEEMMKAIEQLWTELSTIANVDLDLLDIQRLIGVHDVMDAVVIAIGEIGSDDPEVNERFRIVRMESHRTMAQRHVDRLLVDTDGRELTDGETALLDQCQADLELIASGVEP